jgi:hypothetical protein
MVQDIIVFVLITAALANIIYHVVKLRKGNALNCGGCCECEIKKNVTSKK